MLEAQCERLVARVRQDNPAQELDAFVAVRNERDVEAVAKAVLDAIDRAELEGGLDRLPTFVIKYVRSPCEAPGIGLDRDTPLPSHPDGQIWSGAQKRYRECRSRLSHRR